MSENESVPIEEAKQEVELAARRLGLLHLSYATTLIKELGEKKGRKLILKAIKDYGQKIGEKAREVVVDKGLEPTPKSLHTGKVRDLPKYGANDGFEPVEVEGERRVRGYGCVMAKVWKEYDEDELGRLYCYVDPAKYMAYNPNFKLIHLKTLPDGDDYCEMVVRPTSEKEREDFQAEDRDWEYIDRESIKK